MVIFALNYYNLTYFNILYYQKDFHFLICYMSINLKKITIKQKLASDSLIIYLSINRLLKHKI